MNFATYNACTRQAPASLDPWKLLDESKGLFTLKQARRLCFLAWRVQNGDAGEWAGDMPTLELAVMIGEISRAEADVLPPRRIPTDPAIESIKWNHLAAESLAEAIYSMAKIIWPERTPILCRMQSGNHLVLHFERSGLVLAYAEGPSIDEVDLVRQIHRQVFRIGKKMLEERNAK